jgi:hypothetical protein
MAHNSLTQKNAIVTTNFNGTALAPVIVDSYTAFEAIPVNAMVALSTADGMLRWVLPPDRIADGAALRPAYAPYPVLGGQMAPPSVFNLASDRTVSGYYNSMQIKSGNILQTWLTADSPCMAITGLDNTVVLPPTKVNGGTVMIARVWTTVASGLSVMATVFGGLTQLRTYTDAGVMVSHTELAGFPLDMGILSGGNLAVCVGAISGGVSIAIYDVGLNTVLAPTQVVAPAAGIANAPGNATFTQVIPLIGGGFGLAAATCNGIATDSIPRFLTFNSAGLQQGATVLGRTQTGSNSAGRFAATALANGGWAVFETNFGNPLQLRGFAANGSQPTATITVVPGTGGQTLGNATQLANGTIIVGWVIGNTPAQVWTACYAADLSNGYTTLQSGAGVLLSPPAILPLGGAQFVFFPGTGNTIRWMIEAGGTSPFQADTTILSPQSYVKLFSVAYSQIPSGSITIGAATAGGSIASVATYYHARGILLPIGVATASAAQGQPVTIQTTGTTKLARVWAAPQNIDARALGGNTLSISGTTVTMQGVQVRAKVTGLWGSLSGVGNLPTWTASGTARITINCSCLPGVAGAVYNDGMPFYRASTNYSPNDTITFTMGVGQLLKISTDGGAAAIVSIVED